MGSNSVAPGLEIYDGRTGLVHGVITYQRDVEEQYTMRRLRNNMWSEAYFWVLEKTCNSARDIAFVRMLTEKTNRENHVIGSLTILSKESGLSRTKVSDLLNRLIKVGFLSKEAVSVHMINPYVYIGNKVYITSKTAKAMLQVEWMKKHGYPPEPSELNEVETLITNNYDNHS